MSLGGGGGGSSLPPSRYACSGSTASEGSGLYKEAVALGQKMGMTASFPSPWCVQMSSPRAFSSST